MSEILNYICDNCLKNHITALLSMHPTLELHRYPIAAGPLSNCPICNAVPTYYTQVKSNNEN